MPAWAQSLLGHDAYSHVVYVSFFNGRGGANDDLAHLADLPHVPQLSIAGDAVTPEALRHLSGLRNFQELSLNVPMTDEGLRHFSRAKSLEMLFLIGRIPREAGC